MNAYQLLVDQAERNAAEAERIRRVLGPRQPINIHPTFAPFLRSIAPPQSEVHLSESDRIALDIAANINKAQRAYAAQERNAMRLQLQYENPNYN